MVDELEKPIISICCSTYNHVRFVNQAIDSILNQSFKSIEILIIDDGSTDGTIEALRKKKLEFPHLIKVIESNHTGYVGRNLNQLIRMSQGKFIMFLSLDDLYYPNIIERLFNDINKNENIQFIYSRQQALIDNNSTLLKVETILQKGLATDDLLELERQGGSFWLASSLFRRSIIDAVNGFDNDLIGDDIVLRVKVLKYLKSNPHLIFESVDYPVFKYRTHGDNSSLNGERQLQILWEVNERYFDGQPSDALNTWVQYAITFQIKRFKILKAFKLILFDKKNKMKFQVIKKLIVRALKKMTEFKFTKSIIIIIKNFIFFILSSVRYISHSFGINVSIFFLKLRPNSSFLNQLAIASIFSSNYWPLFLFDRDLPKLFKQKGEIESWIKSKIDINNHKISEILPNLIFFSTSFSPTLTHILYEQTCHKKHMGFKLLNENNSNINFFKILKIKDQKNVASSMIAININGSFEFHEPSIFPNTKPSIFHQLPIPDQFIAVFDDIEIIEGFQLLKNNYLVLYDYSADLNKYHPAGMHENYSYLGSDDLVMYKTNYKKITHITIPEGILISGRATDNYFHWLIEYLPRLLNVELAQLPTSIPVLIKSNLPKQFYDAFVALEKTRPIIFINPNEQHYFIKKLYVPSFHTFHPEDFHNPYWQGSVLSSQHLDFVRERCLNTLAENKIDKYPKRFFIARSNSRTVVNFSELEGILQEYGIAIIRPELYSFQNQVNLFNNAEIIISAAGAALSNLIFVNSNTKIICMIAERNKSYCIQANLALFSKAKFIHLLGQSVKRREDCFSEEEFVHSSFTIEPNHLKQILTSITSLDYAT